MTQAIDEELAALGQMIARKVPGEPWIFLIMRNGETVTCSSLTTESQIRLLEAVLVSLREDQAEELFRMCLADPPS